MSWENVNLKDVNPNLEPLAAGVYTFQLLSASPNARDTARIDVKAAVTEGEFKGRRAFFSYPDPDKYDWSPRMLKRLEKALGISAVNGEAPVDYLNRAAANQATFKMPVTVDETYTPEGASKPVKQNRFNIFGPSAA